jgi:hypothetical protein
MQSLAQERQGVHAHYDPRIQALRDEVSRIRSEGLR